MKPPVVTCSFGHLSAASPGRKQGFGCGVATLGFPTTFKDENRYVEGNGRAAEVKVCR